MHIPGVFPERLFHSGAHGTGEFHIFRLWRLRPSGPTVPVVGLHTHELLVRVPCATRTEGASAILDRRERENAPAVGHNHAANTARPGGTPQVLAKRVGTERINRRHPQRRPGNICGPGTKNLPYATKGGRGSRPENRGRSSEHP